MVVSAQSICVNAAMLAIRLEKNVQIQEVRLKYVCVRAYALAVTKQRHVIRAELLPIRNSHHSSPS